MIMMILMMIIIIIVIMKTLIIAVAIINTPFQPGDFSTGSTTVKLSTYTLYHD